MGKMNAKLIIISDYEDIHALKVAENKAKQSQSQPTALTKEAGKREKSLAATTG